MDKFHRLTDLVNPDKEYVMNGFFDEREVVDLIRLHLSDFYNIQLVDLQIVKILLQKTFKGIPLFVLDLVDSLFEAKLILLANNFTQIVITNELIEMDRNQDWKSFNLPMRYEKILGNMIDCLSVKEIIILKYASVIGNIFDLEKLNKILPFNNIDKDDLYSILQNFEVRLYIKFTYKF